MARSPRLVKIGPVGLPLVLVVLIAGIATASIAGAVGAHNGWPWLWGSGLLSVPAVWHGQLWRLLTYALVEISPLSLIVNCLVLSWVGRDLVGLWSGRGFLVRFFGLAAASGAVTCLAGRAWAQLAPIPFAGAGPVVDGLIVAWGLLFPAREIRLFGIVRLTGRQLVVVAIGITVLFAVFQSIAGFVPHFAAEALALSWLGLLRPWRTGRRRQQLARAARGEAWSFKSWYERDQRRRPR
jgi:membrane associated rhomboid family serine protease